MYNSYFKPCNGNEDSDKERSKQNSGNRDEISQKYITENKKRQFKNEEVNILGIAKLQVSIT